MPQNKKATGLAGVIGLLAASFAFTMTTEEESSRKTAVTFNQDGTANLKHLSGPQYLTAYKDIVGVATICDGLTKGVRMGMRMTEAQCATELERELVITATKIMACSSGLREDRVGYMRGASVVMAHNIGPGGWCGSSVRKRLDGGDVLGASKAMMMWNKGRVKGVLRPIKGLSDRRCRERQVFLTSQPGYSSVSLRVRMAACR